MPRRDDNSLGPTVQDTTSNRVACERDNDIDLLIFCDRVVNNMANIIGFDCIAFHNDVLVVTKLAKCMDGDTPLRVEILAI